jgi:hypothetical protein
VARRLAGLALGRLEESIAPLIKGPFERGKTMTIDSDLMEFIVI